MNWTSYFGTYCAHAHDHHWAEPANALTNLVFIVCGLIMWLRGRRMRMARTLSVLLVAIGISSWLFHVRAPVWGVVTINFLLAFVLLYLTVMNRRVLGMKLRHSIFTALMFVPFSAVVVAALARFEALGMIVGYIPMVLVLLGYAVVLRRHNPPVSHSLVLCGSLLTVALTFRALEGPSCSHMPHGTHFIWHLLCAAVLTLMIEVLLQFRRARKLRKHRRLQRQSSA